jgi:hypothetical protein
MSQFTFVVNNEVFQRVIVEAVLLSLAVHENIWNDLSFTEVIVKDSNITWDDIVLL